MKFKKGDKIVVTAGRDKGKKGKIERVLPKKDKVVIPGVNIFKKHLKRKDEKNPGGIIEVIRPLSSAKIALICPHCQQPTRIGYQLTGKKKLRICRKCQEEIDK